MSNKPFVGVATPQANPTVEIEMRALLRGFATPLATRLTSRADTPVERLVAYLEQIDEAIRSFDSLELRSMLFACTGSSYLVGADREAELVGMAELEFGIPVITATRAIAEELRRRKAQKIAILAPYPQALVDASVDYWAQQHFEIVNVERIDIGADTRAIYELTDADVAKAIAGFDTANADLVLLSGTGMPTLVQLRKDPARFISSNYCLAMAAYRMLVGWPETDAGIPSALLAPGNAH